MVLKRGIKMERKKLVIATVMSILILLTIFCPILMVAKATDPSDWYTTESGVLDSDYYSLYPYSPKSLKLGFSQFGELIDGNTNVGLEYGGARDPFAAPAGADIDSKLLKKVWINGWYIDIRYVHSDWGNRHVWAGALFADKTDYGKNWTRVDNNYTYPSLPQYEYQETFDDKGKELDGFTPVNGLINGGRKTNGTAITEPIEVLYDGPRRFVAQSVTHIYDWNEELGDGEDANLHLVDVVLTIIFDKVQKEVIVLKDVKIVDQAKFVIDPLPLTVTGNRDGEDAITIDHGLLIQFSNREEWDLGAKGVSGTEDFSSYVHFYTKGTAPQDSVSEGQTTDYNEDWTILPTLPANTTYGSVTVNAYGSQPSASGTYDVAQIISNDALYVGWHAFWPSLSDWSADAARSSTKTWYRAMTAADPHYIDSYSGSEPFLAPLVLGEWDFVLADNEYVKTGENTSISVTANVQFRGVSVYGVTDRHDANDPNKVIDSEVQYQLDEVFASWDLNDAVEKQEYRWLFKDTIDVATDQIQLTSGLGDELYYAVLPDELVGLGVTDPTWTGYFRRTTGGTYPVNSQWVNTFQNGSGVAHSKNWALKLDSTGHQESVKVTPIVGTPTSAAPLTLKLKDLVDFGFWYKYVSGTYSPSVQIKVYNSSAGGETGHQWANIMAEWANPEKTTGVWYHYTLNNITRYVPGGYAETPFHANTNNGTSGGWHSYEYFTNLYGDYYVGSICITGPTNSSGVTQTKAYVDDLSVAYLDRHSGIRYERVYNMEEDKLIPRGWDDYCTFAERVMVNGTLIARYGYQDLDPIHNTTGVHRSYYTINYLNGTLEFHKWSATLLRYIAWDLGIGSEVKVLYSTIEENEKGAYEWTVLGRDAYTSDSLGATLVTAAFKNKDIEIGTAGEDMMSVDWGLSCIPYVMNCFGTTPGARADYKDDGTTPGNRLALKDDWCTTWPVASSNMITVGGPLANLLTSYFNEFTDAFWGTYTPLYGETYTPYEPWQNKVVALTCWNATAARAYEATVDTGYGVITTYKDINGTVGFAMWGIGPRDTFYTSKFFHEEIIYELQNFPHCVTSIILKIDYTDPKHPTFTIVECLGTISETTVELVKGGIHPDP
jgi:hypothetical protein